MEDVLAVIPARGGSKGVPGKNLQSVGGATLLARAIRTCRSAGIGRVVVSSDADAVLDEAVRHGAVPLRRPEELSGDEAPTEACLLHALQTQSGRLPPILLLVQCTSPFLASSDLQGVVNKIRSGADTAFTAYPSHAFLWKAEPEGAVGVNHDERQRARRQDLEPQFTESGGAYAMRTEGFLQAKHRFFGRIAMHEVDPGSGIEVDTLEDLRLARLLAAGQPAVPPPPADRLLAVVFDFDGVMTDDGVFVDENGAETVRCSRADGLGLESLRNAGVQAVVISKERNPVVAARCQKLRLPCIQSVDDKASVLTAWLEERGLQGTDVAYVGNDINDLACLKMVRYPIAVADAHPDVLAVAGWVTRARGGHGAVREVCQWAVLPEGR